MGLAAMAVTMGGCVLDTQGKDRCERPADCLEGYVCVDERCASASEPAACTNTCVGAFDGSCDDGGEGADWSFCALGTDCADCGTRGDGDGDGDCEATCTAPEQACNEERCMTVAQSDSDIFLCDSGDDPACPGAQTCILGACAPTCDDSIDCSIGLQCDEGGTNRCLYDGVLECDPTTECEQTQSCFAGICVGTIVPTSCWIDDTEICGARAQCLFDDLDVGADTPTCVEVPACGQFDSCPAGTRGAACNRDGRISSKGRVCLLGRCAGIGDCPVGPDWDCLDLAGDPDQLGWCTDFGVGAPCSAAVNDDCPGQCAIPTGSVIGVCE